MQAQDRVGPGWFFYVLTTITCGAIVLALAGQISFVPVVVCIIITLAFGLTRLTWHKIKTPAHYNSDSSPFKPWRVDRTLHERWGEETLGLIGDAGHRTSDHEWEIHIREASGHGIYGPYIQLHPGNYRAIFHLKVDSKSGGDVYLATLDVTSGGSTGPAKCLAMRDIYSWDFVNENRYQDFQLIFQLFVREREVEFRLRTNPARPTDRRLTFDYVELKTTR